MSYDYGSAPNQQTPVHADKIIQLIAESPRRKDFRYRTLFGNSSLPFVTYQIERLTPLMALVAARANLGRLKLCATHALAPTERWQLSSLCY